MEANFKQTTTDKEERYSLFLPQFELLISNEKEEVSVLALHEAFGFFWVGFYLVKNDKLILGPFQGSVACYHIRKGKGVCGTSWAESRTLIVPDVEQFPGHIACSSIFPFRKARWVYSPGNADRHPLWMRSCITCCKI